MLKGLITHYWLNNRREILDKSVANCHAPGVHSVMLVEAPGRTIRLFYASEQHNLWRNTMESLPYGLSVGFHPHHCNVTLEPVMGFISNWLVQQVGSNSPGSMPLRRFRFDSKIRGGAGKFEDQGPAWVATQKCNVLSPGSFETMLGSQLHTIGVGRGSEAAWLVFEGAHNMDYAPLCFSNMPLEMFQPDGLYGHMDPEHVESVLNRVMATHPGERSL